MKIHYAMLSGQHMDSTFPSKRWYGPTGFYFTSETDGPTWLDGTRSLILDGNKVTKI